MQTDEGGDTSSPFGREFIPPSEKPTFSQNRCPLASQKPLERTCLVLVRTDTRRFAQPNPQLDAAFPTRTFAQTPHAPDNTAYDRAVPTHTPPRGAHACPGRMASCQGAIDTSTRGHVLDMRPPGPPNANALQSPVTGLLHTAEPASPTPEDRSQTQSGRQLAQHLEPADQTPPLRQWPRPPGPRRCLIIGMPPSSQEAPRSIPPTRLPQQCLCCPRSSPLQPYPTQVLTPWT